MVVTNIAFGVDHGNTTDSLNYLLSSVAVVDSGKYSSAIEHTLYSNHPIGGHCIVMGSYRPTQRRKSIRFHELRHHSLPTRLSSFRRCITVYASLRMPMSILTASDHHQFAYPCFRMINVIALASLQICFVMCRIVVEEQMIVSNRVNALTIVNAFII